MPASHIGAPEFESWLSFQFQLPVMQTLGGSGHSSEPCVPATHRVDFPLPQNGLTPAEVEISGGNRQTGVLPLR